MLGLTTWNPIDEMLNVQREVDRLFNQFWNELPRRTAAWRSTGFQVNTSDDGWRIEIPLPGFDPRNITLEVAGDSLTVRAEEPAGKDTEARRYEQTFTVPRFLDLDTVSASNRHGMLEIMIPLKESVKPRRIPIETAAEEAKQIPSAA